MDCYLYGAPRFDLEEFDDLQCAHQALLPRVFERSWQVPALWSRASPAASSGCCLFPEAQGCRQGTAAPAL